MPQLIDRLANPKRNGKALRKLSSQLEIELAFLVSPAMLQDELSEPCKKRLQTI